MDKLTALRIIKDFGLNVSVKDFLTYYNSVEVDTSEIEKQIKVEIYTFDKPYNNVKIENPANGKYYYVLDFMWKRYLQNHAPFEHWFVPLNDDNIHKVIEEHKQHLLNEYIQQKKLEATIEHFIE